MRPNQSLESTQHFVVAFVYVGANSQSAGWLSSVSLDVDEVHGHEHVNAKGGR